MSASPVDAQFFIDAGASPAEAAEFANQHNTLAGHLGTADARVALSHALEDTAPPLSIAAKEAAHWADASKMATAVTAQNEALTESAFEQMHNQMMSPPAEPHHYKLPVTPNATDAELALDSDLRSAIHKSAVPAFVAESIAANLNQASRTLANATPEQIQARTDSTVGQLRGLWGENFDANVEAVDDLLERISSQSATARETVLRVAPLLTSIDFDLLLQTARYQAPKTPR